MFHCASDFKKTNKIIHLHIKRLLTLILCSLAAFANLFFFAAANFLQKKNIPISRQVEVIYFFFICSLTDLDLSRYQTVISRHKWKEN